MDDAAALAFLGVDDKSTLETAVNAASRGLIRRALGQLDHLLRADASLVGAWCEKARIYQRLGFHGVAARMLRHAASASATPWLLVSAGYSLQQLEQHAAAVEVYRTFLDAAPADEHAAAAWSNLGNSLSALGRDEEANEAFEHAIAIEPARASNALNYYVHLQRAGRRDAAIGVLESGVRHATEAGSRGGLLCELSYAHAEREDGPSALAAADRALALDAASIRARYLRGRSLALLGRLPEALNEMKTVLVQNPAHEDAANAVAMIEAACEQRAPRSWWQFWRHPRNE